MYKLLTNLAPARRVQSLQGLLPISNKSKRAISRYYTQVDDTNVTQQTSQQNFDDLAESLTRELAFQINQFFRPSLSLSIAGHSLGRNIGLYENSLNNNGILYSRPDRGPVEGQGDTQRTGIKAGTSQQDPSNTTQKPLAEEPGAQGQQPQRSNGFNSAKEKLEKSSVRAVPTSSFSRAFEFAGLGFKLATSALGGKVRSSLSSEKSSLKDNVITDKNAELISQTLCRMRGIPLKLGQTLSIQEDNLIPKAFKDALERAQRSADIMPDSQVNMMLQQELGVNWRDRFQQFEDKPIAAASIGQVHKAVTKQGAKVAVKVQYPGVAESIDSDLKNLKTLITYLNLLPKTMYIDNVLKSTRDELQEECDYIKEAEKQMELKELLKKKKGYFVPGVIQELSGRRVLTSEWVDGIGIDECENVLTQDEKDRLGHRIFYLVLAQLFELRYMQTDPNPANYFYNPELDKLSLIDYGAARRFSKEFVSNYLDVLYGAATKNPELVYSASVKLGFLTGEENREMKEAHVAAVMIVGEPFAAKTAFDFGNHNITKRIYEKIPYMVKNRLKAPPQEVYSLHRVLSGTYLACIKLKAHVNVGRIFKDIYTEVLPELKSK